MRICLFSSVSYWHGICGGMEIHGKLLVEELARRGHHVTIISTRHPEGLPSLKLNGLQIYFLENTVFGSQRKGWIRAARAKFLELDGASRFDLILSQASAAAGILNGLKRRHLVTMLHGHHGMMLRSVMNEIASHRSGYTRGLRAVLRFCFHYLCRDLSLFHGSRSIIVVSEELKHSVQRLYFLKSAKVETILNGVDTHFFAPDVRLRQSVREQHEISPAGTLLLFFSHVTRQKGVHLLLRILPAVVNRFPDTKLLVVGDGEYLPEAKKTVADLGLENDVVFLGHVSHDEIAAYLNACDVFVLPTLRQEGLPFAVLEAMACQKPVIISRIGGIPSIVNHQRNGILVTPGDVGELREAVNLLLDQPQLAADLARTARECILQKLTSQTMVDQYLTVFEEVVDNKA